MADFVFHDPTGRRARRANLGVGLLISLAALVVAAFFATLAFAPRLPNLTMKDPQVLQALHVESAHRLKGAPGWRRIPRPGKAAAGGRARPLSVGFYVSWDESSRVSLKRHIDQLDVVSPQWVLLDGSLGRVAVTSDPQAEALIATRQDAAFGAAHGAQRPQRHLRRSAGQQHADQSRRPHRPDLQSRRSRPAAWLRRLCL